MKLVYCRDHLSECMGMISVLRESLPGLIAYSATSVTVLAFSSHAPNSLVTKVYFPALEVLR